MQPVSAKVEVRYPIGPVYRLESKLLNFSTDEEHDLAQIFFMICRSWEKEVSIDSLRPIQTLFFVKQPTANPPHFCPNGDRKLSANSSPCFQTCHHSPMTQVFSK